MLTCYHRVERKDLSEVHIKENNPQWYSTLPTPHLPLIYSKKKGSILLVDISKIEEGTDVIEEKSLRM